MIIFVLTIACSILLSIATVLEPLERRKITNSVTNMQDIVKYGNTQV